MAYKVLGKLVGNTGDASQLTMVVQDVFILFQPKAKLLIIHHTLQLLLLCLVNGRHGQSIFLFDCYRPILCQNKKY